MKNKTADDGRRFVYLAAAVSALGGMLFGYDIGVISGAILFIKKAFSLSPGLEEIVVSSVLLGSLGRRPGRREPGRLARSAPAVGWHRDRVRPWCGRGRSGA